MNILKKELKDYNVNDIKLFLRHKANVDINADLWNYALDYLSDKDIKDIYIRMFIDYGHNKQELDEFLNSYYNSDLILEC